MTGHAYTFAEKQLKRYIVFGVQMDRVHLQRSESSVCVISGKPVSYRDINIS